MTTVNLRPNETQENLFRRFRRSVSKAGTLAVVRNKRWFISKSEQRRVAKKKAARRSHRPDSSD